MGGRRVVAVFLAAGMGGLVACSGPTDDGGPVRVGELPPGVTGLGPAVLLGDVPDDRRSDLQGLYPVDRFGDDLSGVSPARRHVRVGVGDPLAPTVARGLAEDPRDAFVVDGRLHDTELPEHSSADTVTAVGTDLAFTGSRCLVVRRDGQIRQPATEARCTAAPTGGILWSNTPDRRWGGVDLATGVPSAGVELPDAPFGVTPDGRYLFVSGAGTDRVAVVDTTSGATTPTQARTARGTPQGAVGPGGYAYVRLVERERRLTRVGVDGTVRDLLGPVGSVTFTPDGTRALVSVPSEGYRLVLLDLATGTVRPVTGADTPRGQVVAVADDAHAVVAESVGGDRNEARPVRVWTVDLGEGRLTAAPGSIAASSVRVVDRTITFQPGGESVSLDARGRAVTAPQGVRPALGLPDGRLVHRFDDGDGGTREDRLLVGGVDGERVEVATGATDDQVVSHLLPTPDGAHLLVSLRPAGGLRARGAGSQIVLVRLDGTGEPVPLYRGAVLVSLGLTG
ncbi:hypothetical protein ABT336_05680 [Micromonospora sp. NPDC000207]|uniref:hypothetical protein n=1 Tax=Micromonospora sp. NPDC000207 TaxID=3154246 RepID=UPI003316AADC